MVVRRVWLVIAAGAALLALAGPAAGATPFTAGTGVGHDLATGSDGTGHVVWLQNEDPADRVHYCRAPAGGSACDAESTVLEFPGPTLTANSIGDAQVLTPAAGKVVILGSCWACGAGGVTDRTYRWISTDNGANFSAPAEIGSLALNGQSSFLDGGNIALGTEGTRFQAMDSPTPETTETQLATGGLFVYSPSVIYNADIDRAVYAVSDLDTVKYAYLADSTPATLDFNDATLWSIDRLLSAPEGDNDETHLSSGPNGIFLTYKWFIPNDNRLGLRKFDPVTNTFGGPVYVEGANPIDNNSLDYPHHSQDGSGRLHVVWRSLYDDGRLRYTRSDDGGATFSAAANLALKETFLDPVVEAAPSGAGFAAWKGIGSSAIRVVPIDPQPEPVTPPPAGGTDTTRPTAGGFGIGDSTLLPGQRTSFRFNSSEAGQAVLTIQKRVKGLKLRVRGRLRCLPQTRQRLRTLTRALVRSGLRGRALAKALRRRRCMTWKRVGAIRQTVTPGANQVVFTGRIAGRRLSPGRYRARLVITDAAGNVSRTEILIFRVVRPTRALTR
jgi:hypothetical protein